MKKATIQQAIEKLTFLLGSQTHVKLFTWNLQDNKSVKIKFESQVFVNETSYLSTLAANLVSHNIIYDFIMTESCKLYSVF